ncbi:NAD/NADP octopine/nopaline dehydrogenase family protein [Chloroflexota bacterium]
MAKGLPKVLVCGGGNAGMPLAADLTFMGCQVNLLQLEQFKSSLEPIIAQGGIELTGNTQSGKTGLAKLNLVTTNPREAVKGVDLIMVAVPAFGHKPFFDAISPYLEEGQSILVNTSYWACLRFAPKLKDMGIFDKITLAEGNTFQYAAANTGPASTHVHRVKEKVIMSAFPAVNTDRMLKILHILHPQYEKVPNVLWTSLENINTSIHVIPALPMAGLIFDRYSDGGRGGVRLFGEATAPAGRLIEAYDSERLAVAKELGVNIASAAETVSKTYSYTKGRDLAETLRKSAHADIFMAIQHIKSVIEEDLRYFYVSLSQLGDLLGVPTPVTKSIVTVMGAMLGINYWEGATSLEDMGLAGLNKDQILKYVTTS